MSRKIHLGSREAEKDRVKTDVYLTINRDNRPFCYLSGMNVKKHNLPPELTPVKMYIRDGYVNSGIIFHHRKGATIDLHDITMSGVLVVTNVAIVGTSSQRSSAYTALTDYLSSQEVKLR